VKPCTNRAPHRRKCVVSAILFRFHVSRSFVTKSPLFARLALRRVHALLDALHGLR